MKLPTVKNMLTFSMVPKKTLQLNKTLIVELGESQSARPRSEIMHYFMSDLLCVLFGGAEK
jgi:hypothetical protein